MQPSLFNVVPSLPSSSLSLALSRSAISSFRSCGSYVRTSLACQPAFPLFPSLSAYNKRRLYILWSSTHSRTFHFEMRTEARAPISNRESSVRDNGRERERGTRRALSPLDLVTFVQGDAANFPYFNVSLSLSLSLYHLYEKFLRLFTAEKKSREMIEGQEDVRTITDPHFFTLCLKTIHGSRKIII